MLTTSRPPAHVLGMADQAPPVDEMDGVESETSQEYQDSEDEWGDQRAGTIFHAPRSDCDTANSTRSLYEHDVEYTYIHDRRFCQDYYLPNDLREQDRWQMLHQIYLDLFSYNLTTVPLDYPKRILDIGCGTGDWVLDMAEVYPNAEIIGTDIAPIQPTKVPQNVFFEIDDAEIEGGWSFGSTFDFIHLRGMAGAFTDWSHIYSEALRSLEPGGWIEILDFDDHLALYEFFRGETVVVDWHRYNMNAMIKSGREMSEKHLDPENLTALGFEEVSTSIHDLPMGPWGDIRGTSAVLLKLQMEALEAMSLRPLTEYGGWEVDDVERICDQVREAMIRLAGKPKTAEGCKYRVKILKGRKPLAVDEGAVTNVYEGKGKEKERQNYLLSPVDNDTDGESVLTVTKETVAKDAVTKDAVNGAANVNGKSKDGNGHDGS